MLFSTIDTLIKLWWPQPKHRQLGFKTENSNKLNSIRKFLFLVWRVWLWDGNRRSTSPTGVRHTNALPSPTPVSRHELRPNSPLHPWVASLLSLQQFKPTSRTCDVRSCGWRKLRQAWQGQHIRVSPEFKSVRFAQTQGLKTTKAAFRIEIHVKLYIGQVLCMLLLYFLLALILKKQSKFENRKKKQKIASRCEMQFCSRHRRTFLQMFFCSPKKFCGAFSSWKLPVFEEHGAVVSKR